jgi:uncharacterized protein
VPHSRGPGARARPLVGLIWFVSSGSTSLHVALLERLRREGFAGATVTRGVAGFGAHSVVHTAHILRQSEDLPVIIEVVDTEGQIERMKALLDEMVPEGLVTVEPVTVLRYSTRPRG